MFLHSGAGLHGHEYSPSSRHSIQSSPSHHNLRRPSLLRSAFPTPRANATNNPFSPASLRRHPRPVSDFTSRTRPPLVTVEEPATVSMLETPNEKPVCEDAASDTDASDAATAVLASKPVRKGKRRRTTRARTTYRLCLPPPRLLARTKVMQKVLPRLLLQLQRIGDDRRSRPVMDVFPASRIAGPVIAPRMAKRFPGIFGPKRQLGYDDVVLVRRDNDSVADSSEEDSEDNLETDDIMAVYSPLKRSDHAEIVLEDGSIWHSTPWRNGSFDFVHQDEHGRTTTVRWARRNEPARPWNIETGETVSTAAYSSQKFTFSIISPLSRRHPVMATLTPDALQVYDSYTSISTQKGNPSASIIDTQPSPPSPPDPTLSGEGALDVPAPPEANAERCTNNVDHATKRLICVTGVWVALRSGWSPNYTPVPTSHELPSVGAAKSSRRHTWTRSESRYDTFGIRQTSEPECHSAVISPMTTNDRSAPMTPALTHSSSSPPSSLTTPTIQNWGNFAPRRVISTGAAYMQSRIHLQQHYEGVGASSLTTPRKTSLGGGRRTNSETLPIVPTAIMTDQDSGSRDVLDDGIGALGVQHAKDEIGKKGVRARFMKMMHGLRVR